MDVCDGLNCGRFSEGAANCLRVAEHCAKHDLAAWFPCQWNELTVPVSPVELALGGES